MPRKEPLLKKSRPDALIVGSDLLIPEIDAVLRKRKIRIPVVGCDGVVPREPPDDYSTVQAPRRECGRLAAELLLKAVRNPGGKIGRR